MLVLSGCSQEEKKIIKEDRWKEMNTGISFIWERQEINLHWNINSWINIPEYNILISWNNLIYNNLFSIKLLSKVQEWDFYKSYWEVLNITDKNMNNIQIIKYTTEQNSKCDFNFEEWVKKISKSTKIINWFKANLANVLFYITWPDTPPTYSRQSFLCFSKDNSVYKITIFDDSKFRTDIIDSFKFLK